MDSLKMEENSPVQAYRCSSGIAWAVEKRGLVLINRNTGKAQALSYPEAALWDFLSREVPLQKIISMLAIIAGTGIETAELMVASTVDGWCMAGWLTREAGNG